MSLEAVQKVTETEQRARARKAEATDQAKKLIAEASREGKEHMNAARAEAEAQVKAMFVQAEASAGKQAEAAMRETRQSCDSLRHAAEGKLEDAAALIIRRVVGV